MSDGGKGSSPRPFGVGQNEFGKRWDAIFKSERELPEDLKICQRCSQVIGSRPTDIHTCTPKAADE
jgi:hypothetical protein